MNFVEQIPVMADNYIYILLDKDTKQTACVDPGVTNEVESFFEKPKLEDARIYIERGYLWNSGIYGFKSSIFSALVFAGSTVTKQSDF